MGAPSGRWGTTPGRMGSAPGPGATRPRLPGVMRIAFTRPVSPSLARCELSFVAREPIDLARAEVQHAAYVATLAALGCRVEALPVEPELPDAVFVEDPLLVFDELAVVTRPGAASRRPEAASLEAAVSRYRPVRRIEAPATIDGGDVLRLGRAVYVGGSARSDPAAVAQLGAILAPYGYTVTAVPIRGCLHLKSAVTQVDDATLLVNRAWVDPRAFPGFAVLDVHPDEPHAANVLRVGDSLVYPSAHPRTRERLGARDVHTVDVSELMKAEGAVTCCSVVFEA